MDYREEALGEAREQARDGCEFPVKDAPEFSGPCPELLYELESPKYENFESLIARVSLRDRFITDGKNSTIRHYKQDESLKSIRQLLEVQPNNVQALFYEWYAKYRVETEEDVVASLKAVIKRYELDPNCSRDWMFIPNEIVDLIDDLLIQRGAKNSNVAVLSKMEFAELASAAFEAMQSQYEHVYRTSENIRKLDYAKRLIEHPFLYLNEDLAKEFGNVLDINPEEYMDARRKLIIEELIDLYVLDPTIDERQSLGMMCNDYAFEIGLANECIDLISRFVEHYRSSQGALSPWVLEATIFLAMAASRACEPYSQEANVDFMYLHCTFCHQTLYCLREDKRNIRTRIAEIFDTEVREKHEFEYHLAMSYVDLNERSLRHYRRALEIDNAALLHSTLLAKRLKYEGFADAAIGVLAAAIEQLSEMNIRAVAFDRVDYLGSETCNSSFYLKQKIRDLSGYLSEITKMKDVLQAGRYYTFFESGRCSLRWDN